MTYRATLYYTGGRTESVTVKADGPSGVLLELRKIPGWECYTLEKVKRLKIYH